MSKVRKILPVSTADILGLEKWLEDQANNGLFPVSIGRWATFTTTGVPGTRFRLEPYGKCGDSPTEEQISLYCNAGWEYAFAIGASYYFLFYTTDPSAVELYSDHESRGLSLERLEKATQRAQRRTMIFYLVLIAVIAWFLFFYKSKFDVQPNNLAYLPIVLLQIFNPVFLVFIIAQIFIFRKNGRDLRLLKSSCKALKEGMAPPPSAGPSKKIVWENVMSLVAIIPIAILILGQYSAPYSNIPLDDFKRPYIEMQAMESTPVYQWNDLFEDPPFRNSQGTYYADVEYSLLAPSWYSVTQEAYSPQNGTRGNVFSKDPENGAHRYSPELDTTCFHLLDFVIIATEPNEIGQMAALGKGGNVAVFRYGGQEKLRDHLDLLSTLIV